MARPASTPSAARGVSSRLARRAASSAGTSRRSSGTAGCWRRTWPRRPMWWRTSSPWRTRSGGWSESKRPIAPRSAAASSAILAAAEGDDVGPRHRGDEPVGVHEILFLAASPGFPGARVEVGVVRRVEERVAGGDVEAVAGEEPAGDGALDDVEGDDGEAPQALAEDAAVELAVVGGASGAALRPDGAAPGVASVEKRAAQAGVAPEGRGLGGWALGRRAQAQRRDAGAGGDATSHAGAALVGAGGEDAADEVRREVGVVGAAARVGVKRPLGRKVGRARQHGAAVAGRARLDGRGPAGDLGEPALVGGRQHGWIVRQRCADGQGASPTNRP